MAFKVDENANIFLIQGDSGTFIIDGLPTDKNYAVYFAVTDENRNTVGGELLVYSNYSSKVIFSLTGDYTDLLTVPKNEEYAVYYYGIKLCDLQNDVEDTLVLAGNDISGVNMITVYPKKVEGV